MQIPNGTWLHLVKIFHTTYGFAHKLHRLWVRQIFVCVQLSRVSFHYGISISYSVSFVGLFDWVFLSLFFWFLIFFQLWHCLNIAMLFHVQIRFSVCFRSIRFRSVIVDKTITFLQSVVNVISFFCIQFTHTIRKRERKLNHLLNYVHTCIHTWCIFYLKDCELWMVKCNLLTKWKKDKEVEDHDCIWNFMWFSGDAKLASLLPQSATKSASNIYHHQLVLYQPADSSVNTSQSMCHGFQKQRGVSVPNLGSFYTAKFLSASHTRPSSTLTLFWYFVLFALTVDLICCFSVESLFVCSSRLVFFW